MARSENKGSARSVTLSGVETIEVAGGLFQPIRRALGVRAFGVNAYSARAAGDQLIERHDETGSGSGHHEELYVVLSGRATFTIDGEEIDAPTGTLVFAPEIGATRSAVATAPDTTVLVVGGPADRPLPVSPFEYWFVAEAPYLRGDHQLAIEILSEALTEWPEHGTVHYQLACNHALAGNRDEALVHFERACAADPRVREWASDDSDLDAIRDDPRFAAAIS